ncbi:hypothetical protein RMR16_026660 (plasmid) [Agrobacterium sp. rho-13.3]|uniref:hypothetical protein n=1 Tax=Agrobacterium sp. rho-13.3 TaxID=3072980 RepID=UPI002A0D4D82|nr:hypothetical protein [Agrobacterium sp. rho-13.3]MDX8311546.1 hypothetical protein [Agrobacterium sp. rho-13.3]
MTDQGGKDLTVDQGHFKGMAVVIDDGIKTGEADILEIVEAIRAGGGYPITLHAIPEDLTNFSNAAFFVMDWNLIRKLPGMPLTPALVKDNAANNLRFLKAVAKIRHAPIFIFTNEDPAEVREFLESDEELRYVEGESHILIKRKIDVKTDVYRVLNEWANTVPSVLTLKVWERTLHNAVNSLFIDFQNRSPHWPVMFWQAANADRISPEVELSRLITRLVVSRMAPMTIDLAPFEGAIETIQQDNADAYYASLIKVLEGERIVSNDFLGPRDIAPGDFFEVTEADAPRSFLLNIRSECDCARGNPKLYLLKGKIVHDVGDRISADVGNIDAEEKHNEAIVVLMYQGLSISFSFRDLQINTWNSLRAQRKGRLLSPFLARVVQRYGAYSSRPGLPRLPPALVNHLKRPKDTIDNDDMTDVIQAACKLDQE